MLRLENVSEGNFQEIFDPLPSSLADYIQIEYPVSQNELDRVCKIARSKYGLGLITYRLCNSMGELFKYDTPCGIMGGSA